MHIFGVIIVKLENGILETNLEIKINILSKNITGIIKIFAIWILINDIKITKKPAIIQIAIIGAAKTFDNQNINENWLK